MSGMRANLRVIEIRPAKILKGENMCLMVISNFNCLVITEYVLGGAWRSRGVT